MTLTTDRLAALRRPNLMNRQPRLPSGRGMRISVSSSVASRTVCWGPTKNSVKGTSLSLSRLVSFTSASRASRAEAMSAAGDALHRFPPTVARLRTRGLPTLAAASAKTLALAAIRGDCVRAAILVVGPM